MTRLNKKGDTIVEVLLALVVLTTVIVGAYAASSRAQNASQAAQERAEALKRTESQIERLKGLLSGTAPPTIPGGSFCIDEATNTIEIITAPADPFSESLEAATLPYSVPCGNLDGRYNVAVKYSGDTYTVLVRWERIGGSRDQIEMYYRAY